MQEELLRHIPEISLPSRQPIDKGGLSPRLCPALRQGYLKLVLKASSSSSRRVHLQFLLQGYRHLVSPFSLQIFLAIDAHGFEMLVLK